MTLNKAVSLHIKRNFFLETLLKFAQGDIEFTQILVQSLGSLWSVRDGEKKDTPLFNG